MSDERDNFRNPPFTVEQVYTPQAVQENVDWGLTLLGVPDQWKRARGKGILLAVLDTGAELGHPDLQAGILDAEDFTRSPKGSQDVQGHGTHCCGIAAARENGVGVKGVAPDCKLLVGKVLGDNGSGYGANIAAGVRWAVANGADVISMSLGSPNEDTQITAAIDEAILQNVVVVCAAGNDGQDDSVNYPGRMKSVITVAAHDRYGRISPFSSRGDRVDVSAPGQDILSSYLRGGYAKLSGTSMATPFVAGMACLVLGYLRDKGAAPRQYTPEQAKTLLQDTSRDIGLTGRDTSSGWGIIDPVKLLDRVSVATPVVPPLPVDPDGKKPTRFLGYTTPDGDYVFKREK